jgi:hypothetical protein
MIPLQKMRFFDEIQQWCKTALFPHSWAMPTTKNAWKGPKYVKFAHIGNMVYSKGTDVHCEAQMRRWYGNLWKEKWLHRTIRNIIKKPVNRCNQRYYHVEYINPDKTTKLHELRDICCRDTPPNVEDVLPHHPILGLPDVTTPQGANLNTVTISPKLYDQMADMLMTAMPETQEEDGHVDNVDNEPSCNDSACLSQCLLTQSLGLQIDLTKQTVEGSDSSAKTFCQSWC